MRWIVGLLLVTNVAAYMWHVAYRDIPSPDGAAEVIDADGMRLLSEQAPAPEDTTAAAQTISAARTPPAQERPPVACLRIGPFVAPLGVQAAGERLSAIGLAPVERTVARRTVRAHRVFLGPFEDATGLAAARLRLNESGITDHYVIRGAQGGGVVSLGLFSREQVAADYSARLAERGIDSGIRVEDRELGATHWLELLDAEALRGKGDEVQAIQWSEQQVAVQEIDCPQPATARPAAGTRPVTGSGAGVESAPLPAGPHSSVGRAADL